MALAISTFFQQVLRYQTVYPYTKDASLPIAQYMNGSDYAQIGYEGSTSGIDSSLLAAPYVALFNPPNTTFSATTLAYCSTSNCTFEPYQTLGICNTCKDLSSTLKTTKIHMDPHDNPITAYNTNYHTLSNGFGLTGIQPGDWINQVDFATTLGMLNITTNPIANLNSIAFAQNGSKLLNVFAVGTAPGTIPEQPDTNYSASYMTKLFAQPVAFECLLQFCVRNMRAEFTNGTLFETEISTWTDQTQPVPTSNLDIVLQPPGSSTTFVATKEAIDGTKTWLSSLLIGNATIDARRGHIESPAYSSVLTQPLFSAMNTTVTGFPDMINNLAHSLSLSLRQIKYQPVVHGKTFSTTTAAVVTWAWLTLPLFELAASLIFLIIVMMKTNKEGLSPWSNNILAYLFHGLSERPSNRRVEESQGDMEDSARGLLVGFQRHEDGGGLTLENPKD